MKGLTSRLSIAVIMALMLMNPLAQAKVVHAEDLALYESDEVLLKLLQPADLVGVASQYALHPVPLDQFGSRAIYRMQVTDGASPPDRAAALMADPRVIYAEPNFFGQAPEGHQKVSWAKGGGDEEYREQWAAGLIRLAEAHAVTRGAGVTVAVLDTGIDATHPALAGRLVSGFDFVDMDSDPSEVGSHDQDPVYGHGTHVAGLVVLVAPDAKIMPVRVLDPDGVGNIWVLAEALAYAINPDGDPNTADGAQVINLSLGTERPTNLLAEIVAAVTCEEDDDQDENDDDGCLVGPNQHGAVVVAAAGNTGADTPEYPAAEKVVGSMAIAASTEADALASFSNYGSWVHVAAPGEGILSPVPGGEYAVWSGTSMATPLVAGEAALVRAQNPMYDAASIVGQIISKSEDIGGAVPKRIDVAAALGIPMMSEYQCTGTVHALTVDTLIVPKGETCNLDGARVKGSVKVEESATLNASKMYVKGSLQAQKAASVNISDSSFGGSVEIEEGGSAQLYASQISGDAKFIKNSGSLTIRNNTIRGNLQCKENRLRPTGGGNIVQGNKEDQCSRL